MRLILGSLSFSARLASRLIKLVLGVFGKALGVVFSGFRFGMRHGGFILFAYFCRFMFRLFTRPIMIGAVLGAATTFVLIDAGRRKRVLELVGL